MISFLFATTLAAVAGSPDVPSLPDPNSYTAVGWFIVTAAAVAAGWNQIDDLIGRKKSKPPAGELQLTATGLSHRVTKLEESYAEIRSELSETRTALMRDNDERRQAIEHKLDALRAETKADLREFGAKLDRLTTGNEERVLELHRRVDAILDAVAELRGRILTDR